MLPLYLLTNAKGQQLSVELKSGEIVEGMLTNVDNWMNLTLSNIKEYRTSLLVNGPNTNQTAKEDVEILTIKEIYLKGIYIKYIKLQDNIIDSLKQQIIHNNPHNNRYSSGNKKIFNRGGNRYNNRDSRHYGGQYQGNKRHFKNDVNRRNYNQNNSNEVNNSQHHKQIQLSDSITQPNINGIGGYVQYHGIVQILLQMLTKNIHF